MVLSSHTSSLFWFRLDMMKAFLNQGHQVVALGSEAEETWREKFNEHGIQYRQLTVERNGINPLSDLKTLNELNKIMKHEQPDKIFAYQAKTIVYGSVAAKLNGIQEFYPLVAGLGSIFRGYGLKNKIIKSIMQIQYKLACRFSKRVFFQNHDDKNEFVSRGIVTDEKVVIINGSGVDLTKFYPVALPDKTAFLFIGRLIKDKGVMEYLEACKVIKEKYPDTLCMLVGPFDSNPSALTAEELKPYTETGIIDYYGEQTDVRPYLTKCSTYVLPSYHEGTPKTVLEAMAMGRAILTSDAPGCRETVIDGENGFLIEVKNVKELADRMETLISDQELTHLFGKKSAAIARNKYDVKKVNQSILETMNIYEKGINTNESVQSNC